MGPELLSTKADEAMKAPKKPVHLKSAQEIGQKATFLGPVEA